MSKIIHPPHIAKIEGVLELLVHPEKGAAYLQQVMAMHDAITEKLGIVTTKEKADDLLAQAQATYQTAVEKVANAEVAQREIENDAAARLAQVQAAEAQHAITVRARSAELDQRAQALDAAAQVLGRQVNDLAAKEADLIAREKALQDGVTSLKVEKDAWAKKLNALKEVGL